MREKKKKKRRQEKVNGELISRENTHIYIYIQVARTLFRHARVCV